MVHKIKIPSPSFGQARAAFTQPARIVGPWPQHALPGTQLPLHSFESHLGFGTLFSTVSIVGTSPRPLISKIENQFEPTVPPSG